MLNDGKKHLLNEIFNQSLSEREGVDALKFRAKNEDNIASLDELEQLGLIQKEKNKYKLNLLAISMISEVRSKAEGLLYLCKNIFENLRVLYKENPGASWSIDVLSQKIDLPSDMILKGLPYLFNMPIWSSYTTNLKLDDASVTPSEGILKYKTFQDLISQLEKWIFLDQNHPLGNYKTLEEFPSYPSEQSPLSCEIKRGTIPKWLDKVNPETKELMKEIYFSLENEMRALPSMGLRTIIDIVCNDLVGDKGGFEKKVNLLVEQGHITVKKKEIINSALEVGHASAHRGYFPDLSDLNQVVDIVEHLLQEIYVLGDAAKKLNEKTPKRP
jgi:hypothetical protein